MKTVMLLAVTLFFLFNCEAPAEENLSGLTVLATAKMQGGDEFVSRFWVVEAARLGMSVEQMSKQCDSAVILYDTLWKKMEKKTP